jgi:hypothetical protein
MKSTLSFLKDPDIKFGIKRKRGGIIRPADEDIKKKDKIEASQIKIDK